VTTPVWRVFSVKIRTLIHNFDEVGQKLYEVGQLVYEVGQLLDEVSPLTYELGYGRLAHIYEKNPGEEPGNEAIISGCAGVRLLVL